MIQLRADQKDRLDEITREEIEQVSFDDAVVYGDSSEETEAFLAYRVSERTLYVFPYVGRIVHDEVFVL